MFKRFPKADYIAFNIALVKEVEKHPCLYDYNAKEYSNREIVQDTWEAIASHFNSTAKDCRETWKNLRIVFSRNVKKPPSESSAKKKPYYLLESMSYLMPFMKIVKRKRSKRKTICSESTSSDEQNSIRDEDEDYINAFNEQSSNINELEMAIKEEYELTNDKLPEEIPAEPQPEKQNADHMEVNKRYSQEIPTENPPRKKQKVHENNIGDTNRRDCSVLKIGGNSYRENYKHQFLLSLLPDLDDMNEAQFRSFRLEVCKVINNTFSAQPTNPQLSNRVSSWNSFRNQPVVNLGEKCNETSQKSNSQN